MTYDDGSPVAVGDTVVMPGWDFVFEVRDYRAGGSQVVIANVTPGFKAVGTSTVHVRDLVPVRR